MDSTSRTETLWWDDKLPEPVLARGRECGVGCLCGCNWAPVPLQTGEVSIIWWFQYAFFPKQAWGPVGVCGFCMRLTKFAANTYFSGGWEEKFQNVGKFLRSRVFFLSSRTYRNMWLWRISCPYLKPCFPTGSQACFGGEGEVWSKTRILLDWGKKTQCF